MYNPPPLHSLCISLFASEQFSAFAGFLPVVGTWLTQSDEIFRDVDGSPSHTLSFSHISLGAVPQNYERASTCIRLREKKKMIDESSVTSSMSSSMVVYVSAA